MKTISSPFLSLFSIFWCFQESSFSLRFFPFLFLLSPILFVAPLKAIENSPPLLQATLPPKDVKALALTDISNTAPHPLENQPPLPTPVLKSKLSKNATGSSSPKKPSTDLPSPSQLKYDPRVKESAKDQAQAF